jgi:hypothetical protein
MIIVLVSVLVLDFCLIGYVGTFLVQEKLGLDVHTCEIKVFGYGVLTTLAEGGEFFAIALFLNWNFHCTAWATLRLLLYGRDRPNVGDMLYGGVALSDPISPLFCTQNQIGELLTDGNSSPEVFNCALFEEYLVDFLFVRRNQLNGDSL